MLPFTVADGTASAILAPGRPTFVYRELNLHIARVAAQLRAAGLCADDRVVLVAPNGPEAATAFLAIASVAQCAPLNPGYRGAEFISYLKDLQPKLVIHVDDGPLAAANSLGIRTTRLRIDAADPAGMFSLPDLPPATTSAELSLPSTALLLHTSGTTSRPKLVALTWQNLRESAANIQRTLQLTAADRCLNVMPLFHIHGLVAALLATLRAGGSIVCTPGLIAPSFFDWMDEFAPTWYTAVPAMHQSILARAAGHRDAIERSRLRFIRSSSAPLPIAVMRQLESTFNVPVIEAYGMTEASHQITSNQLPPAVRKPGSVGLAAGPAISIRDANGDAIAAGVEGFICIRGASVTAGYLDNDAANREVFRDGWFFTGDLGRMDEDGHLYLTGRSKEILNRGGEKISPREVDEVLMGHPAVSQCLTFALPDSQLGEEVGVAVVYRDDRAVDEQELQHFATERLADFKVPRRVFVLKEIPTGPTGKLQRIGLAERLGITVDSWKPQRSTIAADAGATSGVERLMCEVLGVNDLPQGTGFFDAGGDSLLATQLLARLEGEFGAKLTMIDLFRDSSAAAVAARLIGPDGAARPSPLARADGPPQLSSGQQRLWLHQQLDNRNLLSPRLFEILGDLDPDRVRDALAQIVERHEPLRTTISNDDGTPRARLRGGEPLPWVVYDWTTLPVERRESSARELCARDATRPFQLDADLMLRASLHKLDDRRWWLLVTMHHIANDGWSAEVLREELQILLDGGTLPELPARYLDFVQWQNDTISGERFERARSYWRTQLADLPRLELPIEFPRPATPTHHGHVVSTLFPKGMTRELHALGRPAQATLFMTLLAGWSALLSRYAGADDIPIGTPIAGRGRVEFERLIGLFMNTLVLRTRLDGDPTFSELLARVRDTCLGAWDHDLPFEHVVKAVPHERQSSDSPFFQVYFQLRNFPCAAASATFPITALDADIDIVAADLNLEITDTPAGLRCRLGYNAALFTERFARSMLDHFETLLAGAIADPHTSVSRLPLLSEAERDTLISRRLPPQRASTGDTVVQLFEHQAATRGDAIAIVCRDRAMTYDKLNRQANQLARVFMDAGVGPDCIVALCMKRSPEWIVGMLAAAKAGGAYMSLEPDYPPALIQDLLSRSRAMLVIADEESRANLTGLNTPVMWTAEWPALLAPLNDANPPLAAAPDNLAYVFFTSGSTGKPKGVAIEHRNLVACLAGYHWMQASPADTCLQFTSATFDVSAAEVWGTLTSGARCAVFAESLADTPRLAEWIREQRVTVAFLSPSVFNTIIDEAPELLKPLRRVLIGGEVLSVPHVRRGLERLPRTELINAYGPTETTIYVTGYRVPRNFDPSRRSVPIGRPLDNGSAFIVDRSGQLAPDGLPGELWIGGDTVGRGYLHDPVLTAEAFVAHPVTGDAADRCYRTGDRARWLPDGEIEFLGRVDHQVKVRGVRIELGEIEAVLRQHPDVRHSCVIALPHPTAGNVVHGFVELQDGAPATIEDLRFYLAGRLRHQMVPARLEIRTALPLTPAGKIDRNALTAAEGRAPHPEPAAVAPPRISCAASAGQAATSDLQHQLADIWRDVLALTTAIGPDDCFFRLGGDSLLSVRLAFQIERRFGARLTLLSIFEASTLSQMACVISRGAHGSRMPPDAASALPPLLCVGARPILKSLAEALAPRCGFESVATPLDQTGIATMQELVAPIVPGILATHPNGPVMVAGFCHDGFAAIEVAAQLERAGKKVPLVILFDSLSPVRQRKWFWYPSRIRQWRLNVAKTRYNLEDALTMKPGAAVRYLAAGFRRLWARREYDRMLRKRAVGKTDQSDVPLEFGTAFDLYAVRYAPPPLRARVIVVLPERRMRGACFSGDLGWAELGYDVDLLIVPGDHLGMFKGENAGVLAERLLALIESRLFRDSV